MIMIGVGDLVGTLSTIYLSNTIIQELFDRRMIIESGVLSELYFLAGYALSCNGHHLNDSFYMLDDTVWNATFSYKYNNDLHRCVEYYLNDANGRKLVYLGDDVVNTVSTTVGDWVGVDSVDRSEMIRRIIGDVELFRFF